MIEAEFGRVNCISWLLCDNGKVFDAAEMVAFCEGKGIQIRHSAPYAQWMDHTAERNMRTISEMAITSMLHANMPKKAWGWAVLLAVDVLNRTSSSALINKKAKALSDASPLEKWKGRELPNQTRALMPFGCLAFKHIPSALRNKLDAHAVPCVYLGIDPVSHTFLLGSLYDLTISISVHVTFMENAFPFRKVKANDSSAGLLWDCDAASISSDPRLGMFDTLMEDSSGLRKILDKEASKVVVSAPFIDQFKASMSTSALSRKPTEVTMKDSSPATPAIPAPVKTEPECTTTVESAAEAFMHLPKTEAFNQQPKALLPEVKVPTIERSNKDQPAPRRSGRSSMPTRTKLEGIADVALPPDHSSLFAICCTLTEASLQTITPKTAKQAVAGPQAKQWICGMQREKDCHVKNQTFSECEYSAEQLNGAFPIPCDWVLKIKHRGGPIEIDDLDVKQFKCRVVVRGQFMKEGIDFNDTFAPVPKPTTLRAVLVFAASKSYYIKAGDIETAFLTAKMDCTVYVRMPPFWGNASGPIDLCNSRPSVRKLLKGVPGIPQGSRLFYENISGHLIAMGFVCSKADKCLFFRRKMNGTETVLIWVDDFIWVGEVEAIFDLFMKEIREKFVVPSVNDLNAFLGMTICYSRREKLISLSQTNTIDVLLERANMKGCNSCPVPAASGVRFSKSDSPEDASKNQTTDEYRSLIALINFIACWTRPDIAFITNKLCKFMSNPGEIHWKYLRTLIKYLAGTRDRALIYDIKVPSKLTLHGFTDSSFGDCPDTGKSTLAYVFFYRSALLSWYSKLSSTVLTCTNHAEYAALALGAKECEWLLVLFNEFDCSDVLKPIPIYVDNSGVISMVANPVDHQANKHVQISQHYTRELAAEHVIIPQRVDTTENPADAFTKPLPAVTFKRFANILMGDGVGTRRPEKRKRDYLHVLYRRYVRCRYCWRAILQVE